MTAINSRLSRLRSPFGSVRIPPAVRMRSWKSYRRESRGELMRGYEVKRNMTNTGSEIHRPNYEEDLPVVLLHGTSWTVRRLARKPGSSSICRGGLDSINATPATSDGILARTREHRSHRRKMARQYERSLNSSLIEQRMQFSNNRLCNSRIFARLAPAMSRAIICKPVLFAKAPAAPFATAAKER